MKTKKPTRALKELTDAPQWECQVCKFRTRGQYAAKDHYRRTGHWIKGPQI